MDDRDSLARTAVAPDSLLASVRRENQSCRGTGGRSGLRLQQFINASDEVAAGIARIEGTKIGRKKEELHVGIELVKLLEGRTTRLYSRATHDHARFHGTEKSGGIGQIARGLYFEASALEHDRHVREKIAGRVYAQDPGVRGPRERFDRYRPPREVCEGVFFRVMDAEHAVEVRGAQDVLHEGRNLAELEIATVGAERAHESNQCAQGSDRKSVV